jgi:cytoskeletal protein CcmA (bactofilin family)
MSNYQYIDKGSEYTMIGEGTKLRGEFDLDGFLRIDGDFSGKINSKGKILIGLNGRVECEMMASEVQIGGMVKGNIIAKEKVEISSTGIVIGNIISSNLVIEEGVLFHGECKVLGKEKIEEMIQKEKEKHIKEHHADENINGQTQEVHERDREVAVVGE